MIVASLVLIAGAAVLLVAGLGQASGVLLSGSIAASLLAAVTLLVGARRGTGRGLATRRVAEPPTAPLAAVARPGSPTDRGGPPTGEGPATPATGQAPPVAIPTQGAAPGAAAAGRSEVPTTPPDAPDDRLADPAADEDPPDEPAPQQVSTADAARVGRLSTEVLVVDGRPRYHLPGCVHLLGRESESLPVAEAVELGFTPCSLCEPDSALLADARRV